MNCRMMRKMRISGEFRVTHGDGNETRVELGWMSISEARKVLQDLELALDQKDNGAEAQ